MFLYFLSPVVFTTWRSLFPKLNNADKIKNKIKSQKKKIVFPLYKMKIKSSG